MKPVLGKAATRERMREVEEERLRFFPVYERHGALRVARGEESQIVGRERGVHDFVAIVEREIGIRARLRLGMARPHVVRVGEAEPFVESLPHREPLRLHAEVPFPDHAGRVVF